MKNLEITPSLELALIKNACNVLHSDVALLIKQTLIYILNYPTDKKYALVIGV